MDENRYERLVRDLRDRGVDVAGVEARLKQQRIETPSWGYGNSGTRFKVFKAPGVPRTAFEKISDAALVQRLTRIAPTVALHIPWDQVDDYRALRDHAEREGISIGAINPNLFQEDEYKLGSVTHPDARVRRQAVQHMLDCIVVMRETGSDILSLWFADGTNYPGQDDIRRRRQYLRETLEEVYAALPEGSRMLIEYKFFEPAFWHTDLADWGTAALLARGLGPQAQVLVDTGHHAQGTNVAAIVAGLLAEGLLGGFHFNDRQYADDDLIVGSINPFALFLIFHELTGGEQDTDPLVARTARSVAYMIDQSHNIEPKIPAMILSVLAVQQAYAKALLVNRERLRTQQEEGDILGAYLVLREAFDTDVSPLTARVRAGLGGAEDPLAEYARTGYGERAAAERVGTAQGWGG